MTSAERALSALDSLAAELAAEYTHTALQPRLGQILSHVAGVRSLIEQLPDEHARETDFDRRLLAAHDSGMLQRDDHGQPVGFNHDARQRLASALAGREAATP